jgi:hypothetical protein
MIQTDKTHHWTYRALGASNHDPELRADYDYYATDPHAIDDLFVVEDFDENIWECASGENHLAYRLEECNKIVLKTDIISRKSDIFSLDFLSDEALVLSGEYDIITNPPYKYALDFCEQAIKLMKNKTAMLLNLRFLEGQKRYNFFAKYPMKKVWIYSRRLQCARNGDFSLAKGGVTAFAWFVWERNFHSEPKIGWIK